MRRSGGRACRGSRRSSRGISLSMLRLFTISNLKFSRNNKQIKPVVEETVIATSIEFSIYNIIIQMKVVFQIVLITLILKEGVGLSGDEVSSYCHCDLTSGFCDVDCCCDSDCSSTISTACSNRFSQSYCPDTTYFSRVGGVFSSSDGCYYFNITTNVEDEVSISSNQVTDIINKNPAFAYLDSTNGVPYDGYTSTHVLSFGGTSNFELVSSAGACLSSTGTNTQFSFYFGGNMRLSCSCDATCSSGVPALFSALSGATINQYQGDNSKTLTLPTISNSAVTAVQLNFIVGTIGTEKAKYISKITWSTSTATSSERSLRIVFVQPHQIDQYDSPSFFPQIPRDIFYPVYLFS